MGAAGLPYVLSFVVRRDGALLDGTPLEQVIEALDSTAPNPPTGYAVNCVHPDVFADALSSLDRSDSALVRRIVSFQANTSSKRPEGLDGPAELETEDPDTLAELMLEVHGKFRTRFMGGCCGTTTSHIACLAAKHGASGR